MSKQKKFDNRLNNLFEDMGEEEIHITDETDKLTGWNWSCDAKGHYKSISPEVFDILGIQTSAFIGKLITDFCLSPQSAENLSNIIFDNNLNYKEITLQFLSKRENLIPLRVHIFKNISDNGEIIGLSGFTQVIQPEVATSPQQLLLENTHLQTETKQDIPDEVSQPNFAKSVLEIGLEDDRTDSVSSPDSGADGKSFENQQIFTQPSSTASESTLAVLSSNSNKTNSLLEIIDPQIDRNWNRDELALVEEVAEQLSLAMENARLFQETQISLSRTEALYKVGQATMAYENLESLVQSVINTITNLLSANQTQAAICDLSKGRIIHLLESYKPPTAITESTYQELMKGLIGQCLKERKPILLPKSKPAYPKTNNRKVKQSQTTDGSIIIVPLIYRDLIFGTLKVTNDIEQPDFTQNDLDLLMAMSNQLSAALANAQSFEQEQRRRRIAATLSETARVIGGSLELEQISDRLFTKIAEVIDFHKAHLHIFEKDQVMHVASYMDGGIQEFEDTEKTSKLITDDLLFDTVYESNQPLLIKNTQNYPHWDETSQSVSTKSWVAVPILRGNTFIGLLILDHIIPDAFDEDTVDLLSGIAAQAAIAIHNARLYQQSEHRSKQLQTAAEVSRAASSILEPNPLIQQTVNLIQERFDLYYVGVFLIDMDGSTTQDPGKWAVLRAGTGDPGRIQVKQKHKLEVGGTSMIGTCIATHKPQISQLVQLEEQRFSNPLLPDTRSELALPLVSRGTVIGAMTFQSTNPDAFSDDDISILQTMADQVANALQNANLYDQIQVRAEELAVLNEMSRQLTASIDAESISRNMYFYASRLLDTSTFFIALYNRQTDSLTFPYATEDNHEISVSDQAESKGLTKYVIERRQPLLIRENIDEWMENHKLKSNINEVDGIQFSQSWLGVPMQAGDEVIGIINVQHKEPNHYSEQDLELLIAIATQSAIAFQNASLFGETRQRTEDLAVLNDMSRVLANILDINNVFSTVYEYTSKLMDTTNFFIALYDSVTEELKMPFVINENQRIDVEPRKLLGNGLSDYIIRSRQQLLLNDDIPNRLNEFDLDFIPIGEGHIPLSWLGVPMMIGERVIGILAVQSLRTPYLYQERHRDLLASIASQAAITIQNTRLFDKTQQQLADLTNIQQTTSELSAAITLDEVISSLLENLVSSISVDSISLFFIQDNNLIRIGQYPTPKHLQKTDNLISLDEYPLTKNAIKTRKPIAVSVDDPRLQEHARQAFKANGISGNMTVPLIGPEGVLGIISLNRKQPGPLFSEHEVNLTETLASQAAISIQNAQLFEQTRRQLRDLETISNASQKLASAPLEIINVAEIIAHIFIELIGIESTASISMQNSEKPDYMETYISLRKLNGETIIDENIEQWNFYINDYPATAKVMETIQPLVVQANDPEANLKELVYMESENVKTLLIFPLAVKRQSIGIIELEFHDKAYNITDEELSLGLTLANQAAVALDNARLYVEQRETAEQLREIDTLKSQFLANMSHELRTPLNSIIGFSRVIMKGIDGPITDLQSQDLSAIYNAGQHLLSMINNILDISKIEAGKMELAFDDVSLPDIIDGVLSTVRGLLKDKPVKLTTAIEKNLPVIKADPTRIRQIFLNLLSNASKFTDEGSITVTAHKRTRKDGTKEIYMAVTDTGAGIDLEDQKRLFIPFSQVDGSPTRKVEGTGLGLSITRLLIELHNGVIGVNSEPGSGSTFWFTLPLPVNDQYSGDKGRLTVLSIDDDPQIIKLYEQYLSSSGYKVVSITDPNQALDQARQILPFAITLDIMLSDFDSWNLLKLLKSDPQVGDIPVVVCSLLNEKQKGFEYGANDYLTKPILEEDLIQVMEKIRLQKTKNDI